MSDRAIASLRLPLALLAAAIALLWLTGALDRLDDALGDTQLKQFAKSRAPPDDIVLVAIDQRSMEELNEEFGAWPWPRAIHGELIDGLAPFAPKALAFDVFFNEGDSFRPDSDAAFREIAKAHAARLFFPSLLEADGHHTRFTQLPKSFAAMRGPTGSDQSSATLMLPLVLDMANWRGGLVNFDQDADGVGRHARLWQEIQGWRLPGFAATIAQAAGARLPAQSRIRLNWYGRPPTTLAYSDLIRDLGQRNPRLAPSLAGKIVLVGAASSGLGDLRPTPLRTQTPGMELLSTAIGNLQDGDWLRDLPTRWTLGIPLLLLTALAFRQQRGAVVVGLALAVASLALIGASQALLGWHYYAPVGAALAMVWLGYAVLTVQAQWQEHREREATVAMFRRFLDPRVVDELVARQELSLDKKPVAREITILFSDIRGFTSLSETRTPEAVVELLNNYFTRQTDVVFQHGGTLDKFIGDAIMAFWNAPTDLPDHARRAVSAALAMAEELDRFRQELLAIEPDLGDFDIGIGIHSGPAVVGFLGSNTRLDYTAIGDAVNLASRIESTTKGVARVLVSDSTRLACGQDSGFDFVPRGEFHVKGREQPVALFEPHYTPGDSPGPTHT